MRETPETDKIAAQAKPAAKIDELIAELCPDGVKYRNTRPRSATFSPSCLP